MKILFIFPNIDSPGYKPVAISTLSAIAKKKGHILKLYDTSFFDTREYNSIQEFMENTKIGETIANFIPVDEKKYGLVKDKVDLKKDFLVCLSEFNPDLVLISTLSLEYAVSIFLLNIVKEYNENILTLMGGRHCYSSPDETLKEKCVDMICIGEGEKPLSELLDCLEQKIDYSNIKGLWIKTKNQIVKNELNTYYFDLNSLPYLDLDIYDDRQLLRIFNGKVYRSVDYVMKRGCFEQCGYCQSKLVQEWHCGDKSIRSYSVDRAIQELKYLKNKYKLNFIRFHDESFLAISIKDFEYFAEKYISEINLPFVCDAAPQTVTQRKAELLKKMGCQSISMGCESGNEEFRYKVLNKRVKNESVIKAFKYINNVGIRTVMFNLLGFPFEKKEYIEDTIRLNRQCNVHSPSIGFFYPFKGCELRNVAIKNNFFDPNIEINGAAQWTRNRPFLKNPDISYDEYLGIFRTFILYCKLPEKMFDDIKKAETDDKVFEKLKSFYLSQII